MSFVWGEKKSRVPVRSTSPSQCYLHILMMVNNNMPGKIPFLFKLLEVVVVYHFGGGGSHSWDSK